MQKMLRRGRGKGAASFTAPSATGAPLRGSACPRASSSTMGSAPSAAAGGGQPDGTQPIAPGDTGPPVVIENRAGAGGGIGMSYVAKAPADGYTVLLALSSITVIPEADVVLGRAPMYALGQLRPIARFTADPTVLAVRADAPWKTAKDFVDDAK